MTTVAARLPEAWRIQLPIFEGPLDLLLQLVKLHEVEVSDIPVAEVCDQFHEYLALMEELDLDIAAEYIYEAALLIHLKSKLLLPRPEAGERGDAEDPRQELVARLLEYQRLKEASQTLAELDRLRLGVWSRPPEPPPAADDGDEDGSLELDEISLFDLLGAFRDVLRRYDHEHPPALRLHGETFSVRAQFERILAALDPVAPFDLLADLRGRSCRAEAVAAFLAILELARLEVARLHQTAGGEILLFRTDRSLDREALEGIEA